MIEFVLKLEGENDPLTHTHTLTLNIIVYIHFKNTYLVTLCKVLKDWYEREANHRLATAPRTLAGERGGRW